MSKGVLCENCVETLAKVNQQKQSNQATHARLDDMQSRINCTMIVVILTFSVVAIVQYVSV